MFSLLSLYPPLPLRLQTMDFWIFGLHFILQGNVVPAYGVMNEQNPTFLCDKK